MENIDTPESMAEKLALILPRTGLTVISGAPGAGKAYLAGLIREAWGGAVVELDSLDDDGVKSLWALSVRPTTLVTQPRDGELAADALVYLERNSDRSVEVSVTFYPGTFKLN